MQRALVIFAVILLVTAALAIGVAASNWPVWRRAWQWQTATTGWPENLDGPKQILQGGGHALPLRIRRDARLAAFAAGSETGMLLVADADGSVAAWFVPGMDENSRIDGRGLVTGLLAPLYGVLGTRDADLLDRPVARYLASWRDSPRGAITPRQLLWQMSGLSAGVFQPFDPTSRRAQLAAGPDFERAALHWKLTWPPGSHFETSPVNAQLLAAVAGRHQSASFASVLQDQLWQQFAAADAVALLDHRRGHIAAHCCMTATAADWLRLGLLLASDGEVEGRRVLPRGFVMEMGVSSPIHTGYGLGYGVIDTGVAQRILVLESAGRRLLADPAGRRALLWIGEGAAPKGLIDLLTRPMKPDTDRPDAK